MPTRACARASLSDGKDGIEFARFEHSEDRRERGSRPLVRRGPRERPPIVEVGSLLLDPAQHVARRGDIELNLTPKEFALLHYFMRHPGEALSRSELLEHVWDFAFDGDPNIVDVYVGYLRDKIDRPFGWASLETVRGIGYRLRGEAANAPPP